jgi:hypothetical protein
MDANTRESEEDKDISVHWRLTNSLNSFLFLTLAVGNSRAGRTS